MKTAKQWTEHALSDNLYPKEKLQDIIRQIQLNAWKQGMIDAFNECVLVQSEFSMTIVREGAILCADRIKQLELNRTSL